MQTIKIEMPIEKANTLISELGEVVFVDNKDGAWQCVDLLNVLLDKVREAELRLQAAN